MASGRSRAAVPYRSQYASPELIADVAAGLRAPGEDPRWQEAGADTPEEYARWARCGCGMACLQMILAARGDPVPPLVDLGRRCIAHGGYEAAPARGYGPLIYAGFVAFVTAELGLRARVAAPLELDELVRSVRGDEVVLASVSVEIRSWPQRPTRRGGHLVLVFDASADGRRLRFHDPSGDRPERARGVWLETSEFEPFYAGRGVAVGLPR